VRTSNPTYEVFITYDKNTILCPVSGHIDKETEATRSKTQRRIGRKYREVRMEGKKQRKERRIDM
jgi:hypothetical protein